MKRVLIWIGLLLCCGCSDWLKSPVITGVDNIFIDSLQNGTLQTSIRLKVYNPNGGSAHVSAAHVLLYYHNKLICTSELDSAVLLSGNDTTSVKLRSHIDIANLVSVFPDLVSKNETDFNANGTCKVHMLGVNWTIPVKQTVHLNVRELISQQVAGTFKTDSGLQIRSLALSKIPGVQQTQFKALIRVKNNFRFDYRLLGLDLKLYRKNGNRPLAEWKTTDTVSEHAGSLTDIPFSIAVDNVNLLSEAKLTDILHASMDVTIKGTATIGIGRSVFVIPVEQNKHVHLAP